MFASSQRERNAFVPLLGVVIMLCLVTTLIGVATPAMAANTNYYVDSVNGNDSNSGTSAGSPWRTLNSINNRSFGAGDVINLATGSTWTGAGGTSATLTINGAGAQGSPIVVQSYGTGAAPILRNPSSSNSSAIRIQASWVVVQHVVVRDAHEAGIFLVGGADHAVIRNNEGTQVGTLVQVQSQYNLITGNYAHDLTMVVNDSATNNDYGATGVLVKAANNEVSYNRFVNCKAPSIDYGSDGGAIELFGSVDNAKIHHNYANNTLGFLEIGGGSANNVVVAYNVIYNSNTVLGLHTGSNFGSTISNLQFYNNTDVDLTQGYGLFYLDGSLINASSLIMRNNLFYVNNYGILMQGNSAFTHDHNLYYFTGTQPNLNYAFNTGERVVDPMFVNVSGGDFHLRAGSPAINTGVATLYNTDFDGVAVPTGAGVDIGVYEYGGQVATPTPVSPTATPNAGPVLIDNFESFTSDAALQAAWPVANGTQVTVARNSANKYDGSYGMSYAYTMGTNNYGGVNHSWTTAVNWSGKAGLAFWLKPDGSGRSLHVQFMESNGEYWEATYILSGSAATTVWLPFSSFVHPGWYTGGNGIVDLSSIGQFSLFVNQDSTAAGSSTIYFDAIQAANGPIANPTPTTVPPTATATRTTVPPTATPTRTTVPPTATTVPPTATPAPPTATPAPVNLLTNGTFASPLTPPWALKVTAPAAASMSVDTGDASISPHAVKVTITTANSGATHTIQLRQDNLNIVAGRQYRVTFYAKAASARTVQVAVQQMNSPWNMYLNQSASLTTSWQSFTYTFTASASDSVFFGFNLAGSTPTVWFDNASVTPL
jgi:hypothetical protein